MSNLGAIAYELALTSAQALYLFAPLLVSAVLSALVIRFDVCTRLYRPIDGGRSFHGCRVFGDHKTWRGVVVVIAGSVLTVAAQKMIVGDRAGELAVANYASIDPILFGGAMGLGAALGELPNSFVKRRMAIAPGETAHGALRVLFYVWDQIDLLTGAWPLIAHAVNPSLRLIAMSFALALALHPLVALLGYLLGVRTSAR